VSEGIGRLTSAGVPVSWDGQEYILGKFSFRDRGLIENALIQERRRRKMQVVIELRDMLPPDEYDRRFEQARKEAESIGSLSEEEVEQYLLTNNGITMMLWALFEDRYPNKFSRDDIAQMLAKGAIGEEELVAIVMHLKDALGLGPAGNSTGHSQ